MTVPHDLTYTVYWRGVCVVKGGCLPRRSLYFYLFFFIFPGGQAQHANQQKQKQHGSRSFPRLEGSPGHMAYLEGVQQGGERRRCQHPQVFYSPCYENSREELVEYGRLC